MTETIISKPALLFDLPEVNNIRSKFVYNFFSADERVNESSDIYGSNGFTSTVISLENESYTSNISTTNITNSRLREFYGRTAVYPRFVQISFEKPNVKIDNTFSINLFNARQITRESSENVFGRVGVSIVDTALDTTAYTLLSGSSALSQDNTTESASSRIIDAIVNNIQPDGYRYSDTDARQTADNIIAESLKSLTYGFSYLPNIAGTIATASLDSPKNVYVDEIASTAAELSEIQTLTIADSQPYVLRTSDYEASFNYLNKAATWQENKPKNFLVGYIVQKSGISGDGVEQIFDEKIITSPIATTFLDANVAYGKRYRYKVLAIYACLFQMIQQAAGEEDVVVTKYVLFASSGTDTSVLCEEFVAPPPPVDLAFRYRPNESNLIITWNFPLNLQLDIKKFQVFRRRSVLEPFQLIRVYDFDDSVLKSADPEGVPENLITRSLLPITMHRDAEFTKNSKFIYAICAIDAHGFTSNYSVQLEAAYDRYRNKITTRVISRSNAPKPYPNIYLNQDTFVDTMKMSGYTKLNIYFDPEYIQVADGNGVDRNHVLFSNTAGDDNTYKLMIVNTDFQQARTLDIKINDSYITPPVITPSTARVFRST